MQGPLWEGCFVPGTCQEVLAEVEGASSRLGAGEVVGAGAGAHPAAQGCTLVAAVLAPAPFMRSTEASKPSHSSHTSNMLGKDVSPSWPC